MSTLSGLKYITIRGTCRTNQCASENRMYRWASEKKWNIDACGIT